MSSGDLEKQKGSVGVGAGASGTAGTSGGSGASGSTGMHAKDSSNSYDLPRANVYRIVKNVLPEGILLVNDAKIAFAKAAVVFIMYLTATYV